MATKPFLKILFSVILLTMLIFTAWASTRQSVFDWGGLSHGQDRYWTIATLLDAYFGFLTFYIWVFFKESRAVPRVLWFVAIMLLGNMAMAAYVLLQLSRLRKEQSAAVILSSRNP